MLQPAGVHYSRSHWCSRYLTPSFHGFSFLSVSTAFICEFSLVVLLLVSSFHHTSILLWRYISNKGVSENNPQLWRVVCEITALLCLLIFVLFSQAMKLWGKLTGVVNVSNQKIMWSHTRIKAETPVCPWNSLSVCFMMHKFSLLNHLYLCLSLKPLINLSGTGFQRLFQISTSTSKSTDVKRQGLYSEWKDKSSYFLLTAIFKQ